MKHIKASFTDSQMTQLDTVASTLGLSKQLAIRVILGYYWDNVINAPNIDDIVAKKKTPLESLKSIKINGRQSIGAL
jgi:hypothetical protein